MRVFAALIGELNGVFGKVYLLSGLLPAAALMVGWKLSQSTVGIPTQLHKLLTSATAEGVSPAANLVAAALITLALGLLFFVFRSVAVKTLQELPGSLLTGLRECLIRDQVWRSSKARHEGSNLNHGHTVLKWALEKNSFKGPDPPITQPPSKEAGRSNLEQQLDESKSGRLILQQLTKGRSSPLEPPGRTDARLIRRGLVSLYAATRHHHSCCAQEIEHWKNLLSGDDNSATKILQLLKSRTRRHWADGWEKQERYPKQRQWMRPTRLGQRAAVLDDYAERRYGIDTSTLLPRLLGVLPENERTGLASARLTVEMLVNLAISMCALSAAVLIDYLPQADWTSPATVWNRHAYLFVAVPLVLSNLFYNAAVFSYSSLAERVIRCVDLYRIRLIARLGFEVPKYVGQERELWLSLSRFFTQAETLDPNMALPASTVDEE